MANTPKDLIDMLIERREQLCLTQNRVAKSIGVSHTTVGRMETGDVNPTLSLFVSVANQLGYDLVLRDLSKDADVVPFDVTIEQLGYERVDDTDNIFSEDVVVLRKKGSGIRYNCF